MAYANAVNTYFRWVMCLLLSQVTMPPRARQEFHWDLHQSQSPSSASSLKDLKIAASEKAALAKAIEAQISPPNPLDPEIASEDRLKQTALNANIKMIHLSENETQPVEVVAQVQPFCSPTGNCSLWFFQRTAHGYRLLLSAIGQGFSIQKTATNEFSDLVVNMHSSATDQWLKVYRYADGRYWRVACYDADWEPLENGVFHRLEEPRITPSRCK